MEDLFKKYVTNKNELISEEFILHLYENIENVDKLKGNIKEELQKLKRYNNNDYANFCILLNVLKYRKKQKKKLNFPEDLYFVELPMLGKLEINVAGHKEKIEKIMKRVEYEKISCRNEKRGEAKTKGDRIRLQKKGYEILQKDKFDLSKAQKWQKQYKYYIIKTYGRDSEQYEDYMFTLFDVGFLPISPNMLVKIINQHFKRAIEDKLNFLENL